MRPTKVLKSFVLFFSLIFTSSEVVALGNTIEFVGARLEGNAVQLEYQYGFGGRRVLHDDDGQATLTALVALVKGHQIEDVTRQTGETNLAEWPQYRPAFQTGLRRLLAAYNSENAGVCTHPAPQISAICDQLNTFLEEFNGAQSMSYERLGEFSDFIRSLPETGLVHTYEVDRWDSNGDSLSRPDRNAASYFFETDNLNVWLPGQVDHGRCRDRFVAGDNFLSSLASQRPSKERPETPASRNSSSSAN